MTENPYQVPNAQLSMSKSTEVSGGGKDIDVGAVLSAAWDKVDGSKMAFFLGGLIYFFIVIALSVGTSLISAMLTAALDDIGLSMVIEMSFSLLTQIVAAPLTGGLVMMGIRRAAGQNIEPGMIMSQFDKVLPLVAVNFLYGAAVLVGFFLFILPGIYLAVAFYMAPSLVVERNMGPIEALNLSFQECRKQWLNLFLLGIVVILLLLAGYLTMGIGLIWLAPLAMISSGLAYQHLFGLQPATLQASSKI